MINFQRTYDLASIAALAILSACSSQVDDDATSPTTGDEASTSGESADSATADPASSAGTNSAGDSTETGSTTDSSSGDATMDGSSSGTGAPSTSSSSSGTTDSVCGDGILADDEACDDGNLEPEDACNSDCEPQFYTGTGAICNDSQALPCEAVGGECRRLVVNVSGGAVCWWPEYSDSEMQCNSTAGVWTPPDDPFVENNQLSVPEPGVCVTQSTNLRCTASDQAVCAGAGADSCFQYRLMSGGASPSPSLCWWDVSEAACTATSGIWTSTDSMFGMNNPNSIPPGEEGACISQVTNLD